MNDIRQVWLTLSSLVALGAGCAVTPIKIVNGGVPVGGAEVYANGVLMGRTANNGLLYVSQVAPGTTLVARQQLFERPGYRGNHGPENGGRGWTERVYITSMDVNDDGTLATYTVTAPTVEQNLSLKNTNTLIGLHFLASLDWDASQAELDDLTNRVSQSSNYMYNASDGQIYFEQVEIVDDGVFWGDAEYDWTADINLWPHTNGLAGLFGRNWFGLQNTAFMSRRTDGLNDFVVIDHEFGHLAYGLQDEYAGVWVPPSGNFCASKLKSGDPVFGNGGPKASCVMTDQWNAGKYCSGHADDPHRNLTWQPGPCWDTLVAGLQDNQNPARWSLRTPTTRNAIPGMLPAIATQWQTRINVTNNRQPNLCAAFPINLTRSDNGQPMVNQNVVLVLPSRGINLNEGPTDAAGNITIVGAHIGDQLQFNGSWTVPSSCTTTQ